MTATASEKSQTDALHGPNLILDVENFGPIAEAKDIEFKPMTVFVGPSNTGKTYLAVLLHAFLQANPTLSDSGFGFSRLFSNNIFREPHLLQDFLADYLTVKKRFRTAEKNIKSGCVFCLKRIIAKIFGFIHRSEGGFDMEISYEKRERIFRNRRNLSHVFEHAVGESARSFRP